MNVDIAGDGKDYFLIGADIVPTTSNASLFSEGNVETLVGEDLLGLLRSSIENIFNLEVPLTNELSPIQKCGPNLSAHRCVSRDIGRLI